jgi:ubiquinone/menaquinone biosynthesis C-methylase UbiE
LLVFQPFSRILGRQLGRPSGLLGPLMGPVLDRSNRQINATAIEVLDVSASDDVLEIGFGGGGAIARLIALTDGHVAGVDISDTMLDRAQRRFRREIASGQVDLRDADVTSLPFEERSFDRVLSVNTIYFWPAPAAGLREVLRVLRLEGRLVLGTFPAERMRERSYTQHGFCFFDDDELEEMLSDAGFSEVRVERRDGRVYTSGTKRAMAA